MMLTERGIIADVMKVNYDKISFTAVNLIELER